MSTEQLYSIAPSQNGVFSVVKTAVGTGLMLGAALSTGTGSIYSLENAEHWLFHPYVEHRLSNLNIDVLNESNFLVSVDVRTTLEHIQNIKNVFGISMSSIADMLDVSRQAVYKWLANTSAPEQSKQELIKKFSQVADRFKQAEINRAGTLLKMKAFSGRSLSDILLTEEDPNVYVAKLISEAKIMESSYEKSGLSKSKAKPTNEWQSYISIPGFPEEK